MLKKIYEEHSQTSRVALVKCFRCKKCGEKESLHTHFQELSALREQLVTLGRSIDNEDYTDTLLALLPASYSHEIASTNMSTKLGAKALTPNMVIELFTNEYKCCTRSQNPEPSTKDKAFSANTKKKDLEYFNCKKRGHIKADCWVKGEGKEGQRPTRRGKGKGTDSAASAAETANTEAWAATVELSNNEWSELGHSNNEWSKLGHSKDKWSIAGHSDNPWSEVGCSEGEQSLDDLDWLTEVGKDKWDIDIAAGKACTMQGVQSELYNYSALCHMSPYHTQFVTYHDIEL